MTFRRAFIAFAACLAAPAAALGQQARQVDIGYKITFAGITGFRIDVTARFNGASQEVAVPLLAVAGIFAKESGYGFAFTVPTDPVASLNAATAPTQPAQIETSSSDARSRNRPKHLQVVK